MLNSLLIRLFGIASIAAGAGLAQYAFIPFSVPGAVNTQPGAINNSGGIAGTSVDSSGNYSGFIRAANGSYTLFSLPQACNSETCSAVISGFNDLGALVGYEQYETSTALVIVNFMRDQSGNIALIDVPAGTESTYLIGLTNAGSSMVTPRGIPGQQAFLRTSDGTLTLIPNPPGVTNQEFLALNNNGQIPGFGNTGLIFASYFVFTPASNQVSEQASRVHARVFLRYLKALNQSRGRRPSAGWRSSTWDTGE